MVCLSRPSDAEPGSATKIGDTGGIRRVPEDFWRHPSHQDCDELSSTVEIVETVKIVVVEHVPSRLYSCLQRFSNVSSDNEHPTAGSPDSGSRFTFSDEKF